MIVVDPIPAFTDNYIWCLYDDISRQAVIIDPGDAEPVKKFLQQQQLKLSAIIITHHHFDHTGGIDSLLADFKIPVYGPDNASIPQITHKLREPNKLELLGLIFNIIDIPGHTLDHIAFYCSDTELSPILFCGDTLFAGGCGRVFEGDPAMMLGSLIKLDALAADTRVYCAHEYTLNNLAFAKKVEPYNLSIIERITADTQSREKGLPTLPSTLATERLTNPFLRCEQESVNQSAERQSGKACTTSTEVFAAIRHWKDNF
jgi:hydroxyacylglutathione hydrolase